MVNRDPGYIQIYTTLNWGKNYEHFLQRCADLDIEMKKLTNFQMRFLLFIIRVDYKAVVRQSLREIVSSKQNRINADDRGKAEKANILSRLINSWVFTLCLSGFANLYDNFGGRGTMPILLV